MFKKLKEKLVEEVRQTPLRLPQSLQFGGSQTLADQPDESTGEVSNIDASSLVQSSHEDEDRKSQEQSQKPLEAASFETVDLSDLFTSTPKSDDARADPNMSAAASLFPEYTSPAEHYLQSDLESASEMEDHSINLDLIPKEQLYSSFQKARARYLKYRTRYVETVKAYRELDHNRKKLENTLSKTQDLSIRKISELREESLLEKQAKADMEENFSMTLQEKDCKINALQTQVKLLKDRLGDDLLRLDEGGTPLIDWNSPLLGGEDIGKMSEDHITEAKGKSACRPMDDDVPLIKEAAQPQEMDSQAKLIGDLQIKLDEAEQSMKEIAEKNMFMQKELSESTTKLEEKSLQIDHLLKEKDYIASQLAEVKELLQQYDQEKIQRDEQNVNLLHEVSALKSDLKTSEKKHEDLQGELSNQKKILTTVEDEFREKVAEFAIRSQELQQLLEQSNIYKTALEQEIQICKENVEKAQVSDQHLKTDLEKYHEFVGTLNTLLLQNRLSSSHENENRLDLGQMHAKLQEVIVSLGTCQKNLEEAEQAKEHLLVDIETERQNCKALMAEVTKWKHEQNVTAQKLQEVVNEKTVVLQELLQLKQISDQQIEAADRERAKFEELLFMHEQEKEALTKQLNCKDAELQQLHVNGEEGLLSIKSMEEELSISLGQRLTLEDNIKETKVKLEKQIDVLTAENDVLQKQLIDAQGFGKDAAKSADEIAKLRKALQTSEEEKQDLSAIVEELEKENACHHQKQSDLEAIYRNLVAELEDLRREKEELEMNANDFQACIRNLQETLEINRNNYEDTLREVNRKMLEEVQAVKNGETTLRSELDRMRQELDVTKQQQNQKVTELSQEVDRLMQENGVLVDNNITLSSELAQREEQYAKESTEIGSLQQAVKEKELMLASINEEYEQAQAVLNQILIDVCQTNEPVDNLCNAIEFIKAKLADLQSECTELHHEKEQLVPEMKQCREELAAKQLEIKHIKENHNSQLRDVKDQTSNTIDTLKSKVQLLTEEKLADQSSLQSLQSEIEQCNLQIEQYKNRLEQTDDLKKELESLRFDEGAVLQDRESAKKQLEDMNRLLHECKLEKEGLNSEVHSLKFQLSSKDKELEFAQQQLLNVVALEERLKEVENDASSAASRYKENLEKLESEWKSKCDEMDRTFENKLEEVTELQKKKVEQLEEHTEHIMAEKCNSEQEFKEVVQKLKDSERELSVIQDELEKIRASFDSEVSKNREINEKHQSLIAENTSIYGTIEELTVTVEQLKNEKVLLENALSKCQEEYGIKLVSLQEELHQKGSLVEQTKTDYLDVRKTLEESLQKADCVNNSQDEKVASLERNLSELNSHYQEMKNLCAQLGSQLSVKEARISELVSSEHESCEKINKIQEEVAAFAANAKAKSENYADKLSALKKQHEASVDQLTQKHSEELERQVKLLQKNYKSKLNDVKEKLRHEVEDKTRKFEESLHAFKGETAGLKQSLDRVTSELQKVSTELERKEKEVEELKVKLAEAECNKKSTGDEHFVREVTEVPVRSMDANSDLHATSDKFSGKSKVKFAAQLVKSENEVCADKNKTIPLPLGTVVQSDYEQKLLVMEQEHSNKLKQLVKNFSCQLGDKEQEFQDMLSQITEKSQLEKNQMHREHETNLRHLYQELSEKEATLERLHEEKLEKENELSSRLNHFEQQLASMQQDHHKQIEQLEAEWKRSLHKQTEEQSQKYKDDVKNLTSQWERERRALEEQNRLSLAAVESSSETNEMLRLQFLRQSNEMAEIEKHHSRELSNLGVACSHGNGASQFEVRDFPTVETLFKEPTQIKYLRNVLFEYMMGKQTTTLAKVIATILKFTEEETRQILEKEEGRNAVLPQFLT